MISRVRRYYRKSSITAKIRLSYFIVLIPLLFLAAICTVNISRVNDYYGEMIDAAGSASEFSLDFKKDFDYETYLLIVGNKTLEESDLDRLLGEAKRIVAGLEDMNTSEDNAIRLKSINKYLSNLEGYKATIEENLRMGNRYEGNIEIWENDVQIVTDLVSETLLQYIYYEIQEMQLSRVAYSASYRKLITIIIIFFALLTAVSVILSLLIPRSITKPIRQLSETANEITGGNLSVRADIDSGVEVEALSLSFNTMIDKVNALIDQVKEEQVRLKDAELEVLQSQINPHFLYNTLDTIIWLAESGDSKQVVSMVKSLSDFFRATLSKGREVVALREEIHHISSYLQIQHVRYMDILDYEINIPEEFLEIKVPKITLQPIVENALYHGIKYKRSKGTIRISGELGNDGEREILLLQVWDDGRGIEPERLEQINFGLKTGHAEETKIYGLYNVNERIKLKFGQDYGINVDSVQGEYTTVKIVLPLSK